MDIRALALSLASAAALSGCGGGAGSSGAMYAGPAIATQAPSVTQASVTPGNFSTPSRGLQSGFAKTSGGAVYVFDLDLTTPNGSACIGACLVFWPPIIAPAGATFVRPFGTIARNDGSLQLAYNGHPLYTFAQDTNTTNATGDGLNLSGGVWHLASTALTP